VLPYSLRAATCVLIVIVIVVACFHYGGRRQRRVRQRLRGRIDNPTAAPDQRLPNNGFPIESVSERITAVRAAQRLVSDSDNAVTIAVVDAITASATLSRSVARRASLPHRAPATSLPLRSRHLASLPRCYVGDDNWRQLHGWPTAVETGVVAEAAEEAWLSEREICSICCEQVEPGEANTPASFEDISDST
jgi:hypothetical protein